MDTDYEAEQYNHVKYITRIFSIAATLLASIFYSPVMTAPRAILSTFITTLSVAEQRAEAFRLFFISFILLGFWIMVLTLMQSLDGTTKVSVSVILRQIILYIPAAAIVPHMVGLGVHGIFTVPVVTDMIILITAIGMVVSKLKRMNGKPQGNRHPEILDYGIAFYKKRVQG